MGRSRQRRGGCELAMRGASASRIGVATAGKQEDEQRDGREDEEKAGSYAPDHYKLQPAKAWPVSSRRRAVSSA